mmetsp:Transcript_123646/g.300212  ORF Transcript_123646/g.300212 Transcript_123646/m.300212 type:complete len:549 (+) Transcript_123646:2-1648(+)
MPSCIDGNSLLWATPFSMGKKPKAAVAANAAATKDAEACCAQGEEALDAADIGAALSFFEQALALQPSLQSAWYLRGVAAAELWEMAGESSEQEGREQHLRTAVESFDRVLNLDTSMRSENRYLASLARAKLLTRAASDFSDQDADSQGRANDLRAEEALVEAQKSFEEAVRLHLQWGHPALDGEACASWGEAFSQQMRIEIARSDAATSGQGMLSSFDVGRMSRIVTTCAAGSDKFSEAVTTAVDPEDLSGSDDPRWITLHVEHLLAFVDFVGSVLALSSASLAPLGPALEDLGSKAEAAWRKAAELAEANIQLAGEGDGAWESSALRGDVLASAAALLGGLQRASEPALSLPPAGRAAGDDPLASVSMDSGEVLVVAAASTGPLSASQDRRISEAEAVELAEESFLQALAHGGRSAAATVGLTLGELLLGRARRLRKRCSAGSSAPKDEAEALRCLQLAGDAFQAVAKLQGTVPDDPPDAKATAWYNLACIAGLLGRPDAAARALGFGLRGMSGARRKRWLTEAHADEDLQSVRSHDEVLRVLESK